MGLFSSIFSSSSAVADVSKGVVKGIDKAWYTDQEKAEGFIKLLEAYHPFKLAQRWLAFAVVITYSVTWLLVGLMLAIGGFIPPDNIKEGIDFSTHLTNSAKELGQLNNDTFGMPISLILGFYFGGGAVEGLIGKFKTKKE